MGSAPEAAFVSAAVPPEVFREILLSREAPTWRPLLVLVGTLALFAVTLGMSVVLTDVAILVFVLLLHEAGHFVGMHAFGYRDVRMFFVPFLGGAVSGKASGVAPYKQAIVLLLGPLPGLIAAFILAIGIPAEPGELLGKLLFMLVAVNVLNLLPFEPLDGGRLVHLLLSSRLRVIDVASLLFGGLTLGLLALKLDSLAIGVASFFTLMGVPNRLKAIRAARALRESGVSLPERIEDAPDQTLATLSNLIEQIVLYRVAVVGQTRERAIVNWGRVVYDRALVRHLGVGSSLGFGLLYLLGWVLGVAVLVMVMGPRSS